MFVLDTNVISEMIKTAASAEVLRWIEQQVPSHLFLTAMTQAELLYGIELLPLGKRRNNLSELVEGLFQNSFANQILPFDSAAARTYASIVSGRRDQGKPISQMDAQIAAIARSQGAMLVTRNTKDFEDCGLALLNPWDPAVIH